LNALEKGKTMAKGTVNKVILVGRLGKDPDVRYAASGTAVAKFSLATDERVPAGEGNWEDRTEWHTIVAFGKLAEICGNYLGKGKLVYIEGSIRTRQWEDPQGVKRYTTEIVARDMTMLGGGGGEGQQSQGQQSHGQQAQSQSKPQSSQGASGRSHADELPPHPGGPDDDIPF
jgi:single-strand DNA-binding protein